LVENSYKYGDAKPGGFNSNIGKNAISYKITIAHNNKTYYGRIAFFNVPKNFQNTAVASYYKITIPEQYFERAKSGVQSCIYEYCGSTHPYYTWIVWLSDVPL
ncbi:MAG TPA: hypothetical protein VF411_04770, partial [Bacteroidia bacterium]